MEAVYLTLAIFFVSPIVAGLATKLPYPDQSATTQEKLYFGYALAILAGIYLMVLAVGYKKLVDPIPLPIAAIIAATIAAPTILLTYVQWKSSAIYQSHKGLFGIALAYLTLWIFYLSQKIADSYVSQSAKISPTELPTAVNGLTLLYTPIWWGIALGGALLVPYVWALAKVVLPIKAAVRGQSTENDSKTEERHIILNIAHAAGLACTTVIILEAIPKISQTGIVAKYEKDIFISAGFPLESTDCVQNTKKEDRFSILSSGEILMATAEIDKKSGRIDYDISKKSCEPKK